MTPLPPTKWHGTLASCVFVALWPTSTPYFRKQRPAARTALTHAGQSHRKTPTCMGSIVTTKNRAFLHPFQEITFKASEHVKNHRINKIVAAGNFIMVTEKISSHAKVIFPSPIRTSYENKKKFGPDLLRRAHQVQFWIFTLLVLCDQ